MHKPFLYLTYCIGYLAQTPLVRVNFVRRACYTDFANGYALRNQHGQVIFYS